jgi:hypothetical protein
MIAMAAVTTWTGSGVVSATASQDEDPRALLAPIETPSSLDFVAVLDLNQDPPPGAPQLRHAEEARSREWPASLYATFTASNGQTDVCTAALVGSEALLTAAHCVPPSRRVTFAYAGHFSRYTADCQFHDNYRRDASADFALCKVSPRFYAPGGFLYETIDTSNMSRMLQQPVILTGYGCFTDAVANATTDNKYRIGWNTVDETSANPANPRRRPAVFYAGGENNNLFTVDDPTLANLCPGDSGGPAFRRTSGSSFGNRVIVGVNSRVFFTDATRATYGSSLVSATGGPDFFRWAQTWARANGSICGIHGNIPNCRR